MSKPKRSSRPVWVTVAAVLVVLFLCFVAVLVCSPPLEAGEETSWNPLSRWLLARAEEARKGAATAAIKEAKATLSVAFARISVTQAQSGLAPKARPGDILARAFGAGAGSGAQVALGAAVVQFDFEDGANGIQITALSIDGTGVDGVTDTWTIPTAAD